MTSKLINKNKRVARGKAKMNLQSKGSVIFVNKSLKHLEIYLKIDGSIVAGVSTKSKEFSKLSAADKVNLMADKIVQILRKHKIDKVVYNRNGNIYTGKIKMLADAIREKGITI